MEVITKNTYNKFMLRYKEVTHNKPVNSKYKVNGLSLIKRNFTLIWNKRYFKSRKPFKC